MGKNSNSYPRSFSGRTHPSPRFPWHRSSNRPSFEERERGRRAGGRQRSAPHNHFSRHDGRETNCGDRGSAEEETPACWAGGRSGNGGSVINSESPCHIIALLKSGRMTYALDFWGPACHPKRLCPETRSTLSAPDLCLLPSLASAHHAGVAAAKSPIALDETVTIFCRTVFVSKEGASEGRTVLRDDSRRVLLLPYLAVEPSSSCLPFRLLLVPLLGRPPEMPTVHHCE